MSTVADFNRIDDCDKIDPNCIDAYADLTLDGGILCLQTSWGGDCIDLEPVVHEFETCTSLYLSPEEDPNCLTYEGECENYCIHGDDLSHIISMQYLKDVDQTQTISGGDVYMYNSTTELFEPFDLTTALSNINTLIQNINNAITNLQNRVTIIENLLTPPANAPDTAKIAWGTINLYSDHNAVVNASGEATTLDKNHGLYTHDLNINAAEDELFG